MRLDILFLIITIISTGLLIGGFLYTMRVKTKQKETKKS